MDLCDVLVEGGPLGHPLLAVRALLEEAVVAAVAVHALLVDGQGVHAQGEVVAVLGQAKRRRRFSESKRALLNLLLDLFLLGRKI